MIKQETISKVVDVADIVDVIGDIIALKKKGTTYESKCPFHDEKTASFRVSASKQIYKCFGCGKAGDSVNFIMSHLKLSYPDAIEHLANKYNIQVEYDRTSKESKEQRGENETYRKVIEAATAQYCISFIQSDDNSLPKDEIFNKRKIDPEIAADFRIGFAPDNWRFITDKVMPKNLFEIAEKLGLCKFNEGRNHDAWANRLMFPIHNLKGIVVGFGARSLDGSEPKYINSKDNPFYQKSKILYGLWLARKEIISANMAIIVEGYLDVISFFQSEIRNTVGTCGTAFTDDQAKLLKNLCNQILLLTDGDKAGMQSTLKSIDPLLRMGFKVGVVRLPDSDDPDSFARTHGFDKNTITEYLHSNIQDAVLFKTKYLLESAKDHPHDKAIAVQESAKVISNLPNEFERLEYARIIAERDNIQETTFIKSIESATSQPDGSEKKFPGIIRAHDIKHSLLHHYKHGQPRGSTTYYSNLDLLWTWMKKEVTILGGYGNQGKSTFLAQLLVIKSIREGTKWGIYTPEDANAEKFYKKLIQIFVGKSADFRQPNCMNQEELERAIDFMDKHFFYIYPDETHSAASINAHFEELINTENIDGCITDPYNSMDHESDVKFFGGRQDEQIRSFLIKEKAFAQRHDVYKVIVVHPKSQGLQKTTEELPTPTSSHLVGGLAWNQKADNIIFYHRPKFFTEPDDRTFEIHTDKIKDQESVGSRGSTLFEYNSVSRRLKILHGDDYGKSPMNEIDTFNITLNAPLPLPDDTPF